MNKSIITKEQELRAFITGFLTDPAHDEHSENSMTAQVFRIALAAMDAEPVAWMVQDIDTGEKFIRPDRSYFEGPCQPLYAAPPAPVVPDDGREQFELWMLKKWGRERRKSGYAPVIPGWTPVSEHMPVNGDRILVFIDFDSSSVPPLAKDAEYTGTTFRIGPNTVNTTGVPRVTHWMKLPPAPEQENI